MKKLLRIPLTVTMSDNTNPRIFPLKSKPFGMSYENWTIQFWRWLCSIPADRNPVTDRTGIHCGEGQVGQPLFNLAFSDMGGAERTCTLPAGQHLLIPLNVVFVSKAEFPGATTDEDLKNLAEQDESSNPFIFLSVDGKESSQLEVIGGEKITDIKQFRVATEAFDVNITDNPIFGLPGPTRAVSDGYWIILEALPPGPHQIHFKASLTNPDTGKLFYSVDVKYTITVREDQTTLISTRE
jgi:hypothetical protein